MPFIGACRGEKDPLQIADAIRKQLNLSPEWASQHPNWENALKALQTKVEAAGIMVVSSSIVGNNAHRPLDPKEFRGFVLVDEYVPFIFINSADSKTAQMFTLAHELAHLWLGQGAVFDLHQLEPARDKVEQVCNRVAAEFLVPSEALRAFWPSAQENPDPWQAITRRFKVSTLVAARRSLDLGLMSKTQFPTFYTQYLQQERAKKPKSGGSFYDLQLARLGRRFAQAVIEANQSR